MPYVEAVIFTTRGLLDGKGFPDGVLAIHQWAQVNNETLPGTNSTYSMSDLTAVITDKFTTGKVYAVELIITLATAQQFASDNRIFTLGRKIYDDDDSMTNSNWDTPLTAQERTQVLDWLESKGIDRQLVASKFSASDTRLEIAQKLKKFFRDDP